MSGYVSAHCQLAEQVAEYADEHARCRSTENVVLPDGTIVVPGICTCRCHQDRGPA